MDIFKFMTSPSTPTLLDGGGVLINGLLTKEWVERYRPAGSVTLTSRADLGVKDLLPEGSLIGLVGSETVMMVEDHHLSDDGEAIVTTTGRSIDAVIMEQRIVTNNDPVGATSGPGVVGLQYDSDPQWLSWIQAKSLIIRHITDESGSWPTINPYDVVPYIEVIDDVGMDPDDGTREARQLSRSYLYGEVIKLLEVDNIGIRVVRPGVWSPAADPANLVFLIHDGVDRRNEVTINYESGELENAEYLWSIQPHKVVARVVGKWLEVLVGNTTAAGLNRRTLLVDGKDIDEAQTVFPTGTARDWIVAAMQARGRAELAKAKRIALADINLSKSNRTHVFGRDYGLGDIITVRGNYQESKVMRVDEFVKMEDENGEVSYPTLVDLETET